MTLFFTLLPIYIFGNLHCVGMCGPLVLFLGGHRHRYHYFLGRTLSFSCVGCFSALVGAVLNQLLHLCHLAALTSFLFGGVIFAMGLFQLGQMPYPGHQWLAKRLQKSSAQFASWLDQDRPGPVFLFGLCTVLLPCGQTLIVFSACALHGDPLVGFLNGMAFALLTSPALLLAMQAKGWLCRVKKHQHWIMGSLALIVGALSLARGLAEMEWIPHLILNPHADGHFHLVLF